MDPFDCPDLKVWQERSNVIAKMLEEAEIWPSYLVSDHATTLFMDMQTAYCAGAWLSVIVMSISVIDSHLRETEALNDKIGTAKLLQEHYQGSNIDWLRRLRNKYVHLNVDSPALEMNAWFDNQTEFERDATTAIKMTINALFQSGGT